MNNKCRGKILAKPCTLHSAGSIHLFTGENGRVSAAENNKEYT